MMTWIAGLSPRLSPTDLDEALGALKQGNHVALMDSLLRLSRHCSLPPGGLSGIEFCRSSMGDPGLKVIGGTLEQSWFLWCPKLLLLASYSTLDQ